jgi:hypothetical protein
MGWKTATSEPREVSRWPPPPFIAQCDGGPSTANELSASDQGVSQDPSGRWAILVGDQPNKSMSSSGALHLPTKKRSAGGPFVTRVPYNPETSVGLQAALVEPTSVHLHVAEPVRCSARSITLAVKTTDRCCNGCTCNTPYTA